MHTVFLTPPVDFNFFPLERHLLFGGLAKADILRHRPFCIAAKAWPCHRGLLYSSDNLALIGRPWWRLA